jgi:putative membrane protein
MGMDKASDDARRPYRRYLLALSALFAAIWTGLAIRPANRTDWAMENILVGFFLIGLVLSYRHLIFSRLAYTLIFLYLCLHEVGAHYTYAGVPYDAWSRHLTGLSVNRLMGLERNDFDRLVHFSYGFLMVYPIRQIYLRVVNVRGFWSYFLPLSFIMSTSMAYELMEWGSAMAFGRKASVHFVGAEGDPWDTQKDMAMATLGAFITICCIAAANAFRQRDFAKEWSDSLRVKRKAPL